MDRSEARAIAERLAALYDLDFGGKERGRYRISMKHMRLLTGRRRIGPETIAAIASEVYEQGYVLIDLETFFVVMAQRTFQSCRRVTDGAVAPPAVPPDGARPPAG